jgi:hypothetical protein
MYREDLTGTREILWSPSLRKPVGEPGDQNPGPLWAVLANGGERNKQREDGTGGRVNEPPGMDGRKSERPIVPMSPGNRSHRDPEEGRGRQGMEPVEGKMARALDLGSVSTRLHRIAKLASFFEQRGCDGLPARSEPMCLKSRMREFRTSGSVGGPGGQPPGSTRHPSCL